MPRKSQLGFAPLLIVVLLAVIVTSSIVVIKNIPFNQPKSALVIKQSSGSAEVKISPSPQFAKDTVSASSKKPGAPSTPVSTSTPPANNNSANAGLNGGNNNNTATATPAPTTTPTSTPTPTFTPVLKTHTWNGTNINVTTKCSTGDATFAIEMSGDVVAGQGNGVWTTLTGNGRIIVVSYDMGNGSSPSHIAYNFNSQVTSIRGEPSITLQTSGSTTYGYEIKAYGAPETYGMPSLSNQIGNVTFATDCK